MYFRRIFIFIITSICLWINAFAQDFDPPLRLEFDMVENKFMNLELLGETGLVLLFQKDAKEETKWTVCHYDTNFQLLKMRTVPFETKTNVCVTVSDERFFYAVLQNDASVKANAACYRLCRIW